MIDILSLSSFPPFSNTWSNENSRIVNTKKTANCYVFLVPSGWENGWTKYIWLILPIVAITHDGSMYAIYGNIYHQYTPNVSIYTIHGFNSGHDDGSSS